MGYQSHTPHDILDGLTTLVGEDCHLVLQQVSAAGSLGWQARPKSSPRQKSFYCPRPRLSMREWNKTISSLWLVFDPHDGLPKFCGHGPHAPPPRLPAPTVSSSHGDHSWQSATTSRWDALNFHISACTANVNSLSAPTEGHGGKIDFLRRQFIDLNFNFMGVQESKSPEFCSCVDHVLRLSSGCHKNQQGVELWVNLSQPYAYVNNQPVFLDKGDIQVAHKDPRALLARIETIYWQCWLLVAYAPHTRLPLDQREQWWTSLAELAHRRGRDEQMIVLLDANAAPGPRDDIAVFTTGLPESANTPLFRGFVEEHGLFLPCTTPAHHGDITAWTDPTGTHRHCIDYVLLSHHFDKSCTLSRVVSEFDLGTLHWDHEPTAVNLVPHRQKQHKDSLGFDPSLINKAVAHQVLRSYTPKSWTTDIEEHVPDFNQHILSGLRQACPLPRTKPKKPYITDAKWLLRERKLDAKKKLKDLMRRQRDERLGSFFRAWKRGQSHMAQHDQYKQYQDYLWCVNLRLVAAYRRAALELRNNLRKAKQKLIKEKFEAMPADAPASHILQALRPLLGPSNLKKLKVHTLPHIRNADGEVCIAYPMKMEGGARMDRDRQRELWRENLASLQQNDFKINATDLPCLLDLEAAYRRINPNKAIGPDKIRPAFAKRCHRCWQDAPMVNL